MGLVQIATNRTVQGIAECERALSLDRKFGHAYGFIGLATYIGRAAETECHVLHEALRLSPRDTRAHLWMMFVGAAKFAIPFSILLSIPGYFAPRRGSVPASSR
jgi:hypothetical protein